ncbi:hypothetical protein HDU99_002181, partial [Rhizoclosmatium hyalinum]
VLVTAKDKAINKAISIAEITKRQFGETKVQQNTEIGYAEPSESEAKASKTPMIRITLSII